MLSGFILTSNIKTSNNKSYLEISGKLSDGRSFIWLNFKSYLCGFLPVREKTSSPYSKKGPSFKSLGGESLDLVHFSTLSALKEEINNPETKLLEGDVEASHRFLMENKIRGYVQFLSEGKENERGVVVFIDPKVRAGKKDVLIKTMSFDIEIGVKSNDFLDVEKNPLYSIAYTDGEKNKVLMIAEKTGQDSYIEYFTDESSLLKAFIEEVQGLNPQVFIGWNVLNFDFHFLIKKCELYQISFDLGVNKTPIQHFIGKLGNDLYVRMTGRVVLDGIPMLRLMGVKLPNYKLDTAAKNIIGEGKTISSTGSNKVEEIENYFLNDKKRLAEYNLVDTQLVFDIYQKLDILCFQQFKTKWSGVLFDKLTSESDIFDSLYLPPLHRLGYASSKPSKKLALKSSPLLPIKNHYFRHTFYIDFNQINAHSIMLYKIDPLGRALAEKDVNNSITSSAGLSFHKNQTILPKLIEYYFSLKEKYANDKTRILALDNLINIMATAVTKDSCRFYSPSLTHAITHANETLKKNAKTTLKNCGYYVAHEEEHRLYISNNLPVETEKLNKLLKMITDNFKKKLREDGVIDTTEKSASRVPHIIPGSVYDHFFITQTGTGSALKPVYLANTGSQLIRSENLIRGDVTSLYFEFEKDLFSSIFHQQNPLDVIKDYIKKVNNGECDDLLLYRKRIVKDLEEYEKPHPLHVQAAKKIPGFHLKWIEYVVTINGGEPKDHVVSSIDYQHYINKLLKPLSKIALNQTAYEDALEGIFSIKPQLSLFNV